VPSPSLNSEKLASFWKDEEAMDIALAIKS